MRTSLLLSLLMIAAVTIPTQARPWTKGEGQGMMEYTQEVRPGDKNEFVISCDRGASDVEGHQTSLVITIGEQRPAPLSVGHIFFDGQSEPFAIKFDQNGLAHTDTHETFARIWAKLRSSKSLKVVYASGASAVFDTRGARKVLEPKACPSNT